MFVQLLVAVQLEATFQHWRAVQRVNAPNWRSYPGNGPGTRYLHCSRHIRGVAVPFPLHERGAA